MDAPRKALYRSLLATDLPVEASNGGMVKAVAPKGKNWHSRWATCVPLAVSNLIKTKSETLQGISARKKMITPVILSGGSGTRLWPVSRKLYPKQLIPMTEQSYSLLQATVLRLDKITVDLDLSNIVTICNDDHRFLVASQLAEIGCTPQTIILEPVGKNTAPAACVAAMCVEEDPILLILPADHYIEDQQAFADAVCVGAKLAEENLLVTFGVVPTKAETGFGYIQCGEELPTGGMRVNGFVEKPNHTKAEAFLAEGGYLWNSGMFMFKASTYLQELNKFSPEMVTCCRESFSNSIKDLDFIRLEKETFVNCTEDSIDYAVMEKTDKCAVVPIDCGWNDVGSWSALHEIKPKDASGNVKIGDVVVADASNCYMQSSSRLVTGVGIEGIAVIETKDAVMVAPLNKVQEVKSIVSELKKNNRAEATSHCIVYRPWGNYEGIDVGERYQVKRITVYPGQQLSLQKHYHRAEHWIVVKGTAKVTRGNEEILLSEDQSTYISLGEIHRLENPGKVDLELIEVQTGSYLGEDDIVRLSDIYGRIADKDGH